tara:strand:- start:59 stop:331 length:273 start_codon:yes stop_codon:yes gene_type:complete
VDLVVDVLWFTLQVQQDLVEQLMHLQTVFLQQFKEMLEVVTQDGPVQITTVVGAEAVDPAVLVNLHLNLILQVPPIPLEQVVVEMVLHRL